MNTTQKVVIDPKAATKRFLKVYRTGLVDCGVAIWGQLESDTKDGPWSPVDTGYKLNGHLEFGGPIDIISDGGGRIRIDLPRFQIPAGTEIKLSPGNWEVVEKKAETPIDLLAACPNTSP